MIIFTEDNKKAKFAQHRFYYETIYGQGNLIMSAGSGNMIPKINKALKSQEEDCVVYVDVVLENSDTFDKLSEILDEYKDVKRVHVIPIICSEYVVLKTMMEYGVIFSEEYLDVLNIKRHYKTVNSLKERSSLETACKEILKRYPSEYQDMLGNYIGDEAASHFMVNHVHFGESEVIQRYFPIEYSSTKVAVRLHMELLNRVIRLERESSVCPDIEISLHEELVEGIMARWV